MVSASIFSRRISKRALLFSWSHTQLAQEKHHRTPVGEGRLKQVQSDECSEPVPAGVHPVAQRQAEHHKEARDQAEVSVYSHEVLLPFTTKYKICNVIDK